MKKEMIRLEKEIESELRFLNSKAIKQVVMDADIGCCHEDCPAIERRKKKLKRLLAEVCNR